MRIYGDCPGLFRDPLVVGPVRKNHYRNLQYDPLTAPLSVVIATAWGRNSAHIAKLPLLSSKSIVMPIVVTLKSLSHDEKRVSIDLGKLKSKLNYRQSEKTAGDLAVVWEFC